MTTTAIINDNKVEKGSNTNSTTTTKNNEILKEARDDLKRRMYHRQASLTSSEESFLSLLLGDSSPAVSGNKTQTTSTPTNKNRKEDRRKLVNKINSARDVLANDMLFQIPMVDDKPIWTVDEGVGLSATLNSVPNDKERNICKVAADIDDNVDGKRREALMKRENRFHLGLWKAHKDGVMPSVLTRYFNKRDGTAATSAALRLSDDKDNTVDEGEKRRLSKESCESSVDGTASTGADSTEEVRKEREEEDSVSTASSWNDSQGGFDHYNAWEVLKDEYASDFGFTYHTQESNDGQTGVIKPSVFMHDDELDVRHFQIIGTSVEDKSARPHVLSPPLMESLLNFVPEGLIETNFWLKYSLIRDGASLQTLKRYVRAAEHTILAIETTDGNVFGSFTSSHWRTQPSYYGSGEAFLWRMRRSRATPCHSLVEQAVLESEIDVYPFSGLNTYVQLCISDKIAIGGGQLDTTGKEQHGDDIEPDTYSIHHEGLDYGFGLSISKYLDKGTTNPSATFRNPCLSNVDSTHTAETDVFQIANLEVWAFTPCHTVQEAQKLELSKFFIHQHSHSTPDTNNPKKTISQADLFSPQEFYKRVGQDDDLDQRWDDFVNHADDDLMKQGGVAFDCYRT